MKLIFASFYFEAIVSNANHEVTVFTGSENMKCSINDVMSCKCLQKQLC